MSREDGTGSDPTTSLGPLSLGDGRARFGDKLRRQSLSKPPRLPHTSPTLVTVAESTAMNAGTDPTSLLHIERKAG